MASSVSRMSSESNAHVAHVYNRIIAFVDGISIEQGSTLTEKRVWQNPLLCFFVRRAIAPPFRLNHETFTQRTSI